MKKIFQALSMIALMYLLVSLVLSALFSCGVARWAINRHRSPFLLAEVAVSDVVGCDEPYRQMYGYDQHGDYIAHDDERKPGETVVSIFVWNPCNNYCDDTIIRLDF